MSLPMATWSSQQTCGPPGWTNAFATGLPRIESRPEADYYVIDGLGPFAVGLEGVTMEDKIAGEIKSATGRRHAETRPGCADPYPIHRGPSAS